jgi:hypothetical protein
MLGHQYPVRQVCRVLGYARSHDYSRARPCAEPTLLRREDFQVNHQRVARLMREMGLQG